MCADAPPDPAARPPSIHPPPLNQPTSRQPVCLHPGLQVLQDAPGVPEQGESAGLGAPSCCSVRSCRACTHAVGRALARSVARPQRRRGRRTAHRAPPSCDLPLSLPALPWHAGADLWHRHRRRAAPRAHRGGRRHRWDAPLLRARVVASASRSHPLLGCKPSPPTLLLFPLPSPPPLRCAVERFEPVLLLFAGILLVSSAKLLL